MYGKVNYRKKINGIFTMKEFKTLLCVLLMLTLCACESYSPVSNRTNAPSSWAEEDIKRAENSGLLTDSVTRNIRGDITREQIAVMLVKLIARSVSYANIMAYNDNIFEDSANISDWAKPAVDFDACTVAAD